LDQGPEKNEGGEAVISYTPVYVQTTDPVVIVEGVLNRPSLFFSKFRKDSTQYPDVRRNPSPMVIVVHAAKSSLSSSSQGVSVPDQGLPFFNRGELYIYRLNSENWGVELQVRAYEMR
jgi:hypothetical protein